MDGGECERGRVMTRRELLALVFKLKHHGEGYEGRFDIGLAA